MVSRTARGTSANTSAAGGPLMTAPRRCAMARSSTYQKAGSGSAAQWTSRSIRGPPFTFTSKPAAREADEATSRRYNVNSKPRAGQPVVSSSSCDHLLRIVCKGALADGDHVDVALAAHIAAKSDRNDEVRA